MILKTTLVFIVLLFGINCKESLENKKLNVIAPERKYEYPHYQVYTIYYTLYSILSQLLIAYDIISKYNRL